jgi:hypothetical protein
MAIEGSGDEFTFSILTHGVRLVTMDPLQFKGIEGAIMHEINHLR